jgi:hypothetical protein
LCIFGINDIHAKTGDFQPISKGDPLFLALDGTIIPYDGTYGDHIYLTFINEGGYYYSSSGTGIAALLATTCDLSTGILLMGLDKE